VNVSEFAATLIRRWYLTLVALLSTLGACVGVYSVVPPSYEANASVVLLPPKAGPTAVANPYLALNGLAPVVDVLSGSLNTRATTDEVKATAPGTTYKIGQDPTSSAPMLLLTVTSSDGASSIKVLNLLLREIPTKLADLQRAVQVKSDASITALFVAVDKRPTVVQKARIRLVAAAAVFVLAGSVICIALLDGFLLGRARRRTVPDAEAQSAPVPPAPSRGPNGRQPDRAVDEVADQAVRKTPKRPGRKPSEQGSKRAGPHPGRTAPKTRSAPQKLRAAPEADERAAVDADDPPPARAEELTKRPWVKARES
jgi:hypothetical protein